MQARRKYSREYKVEAVQLVKQADIPLTQVTRSLGINPNMLGRWRKQFSEPDGVQEWQMHKIIRRYNECTKDKKGDIPGDVLWWYLWKKDKEDVTN